MGIRSSVLGKMNKLARRMAEHILPEHQLRTEASKQRAHTDKYVSAFVTGASSAELTFQNPVLDRSADHF